MESEGKQLQMKKSIRLVFIDEHGKKHRWTPKFIREDILDAELNELAERIAKLGLFESNGVPYLRSGVKVERRETIEALLFDVEALGKEESSGVMQPPMYTVGSRVVNITDQLRKRKESGVE